VPDVIVGALLGQPNRRYDRCRAVCDSYEWQGSRRVRDRAPVRAQRVTNLLIASGFSSPGPPGSAA
jgi:hypothetical protein